METRTYDYNGLSVTEKHMSYAECEQIYGSSNIGVLNLKFDADAQRATDGNCSMWAMYWLGGIKVVTEC